MNQWGCLGSACIPAAQDDALERGLGPKPGDHVMFCKTGGGVAMAATVWQWSVDSGKEGVNHVHR